MCSVRIEAIEALRYAHWLKPEGLAAVFDAVDLPVTFSSGRAVYPADVETTVYRPRSNI